jgi:hypothetical protein
MGQSVWKFSSGAVTCDAASQTALDSPAELVHHLHSLYTGTSESFASTERISTLLSSTVGISTSCVTPRRVQLALGQAIISVVDSIATSLPATLPSGTGRLQWPEFYISRHAHQFCIPDGCMGQYVALDRLVLKFGGTSDCIAAISIDAFLDVDVDSTVAAGSGTNASLLIVASMLKGIPLPISDSWTSQLCIGIQGDILPLSMPTLPGASESSQRDLNDTTLGSPARRACSAIDGSNCALHPAFGLRHCRITRTAMSTVVSCDTADASDSQQPLCQRVCLPFLVGSLLPHDADELTERASAVRVLGIRSLPRSAVGIPPALSAAAPSEDVSTDDEIDADFLETRGAAGTV